MVHNLMMKLVRYPTALCRMVVVIINNVYCIPTYVLWMTILTPLKRMNSEAYYKIEGLFFHWLLAVVSMWSYTAGYNIVEVGDDITECINKRTLVIANHQSTADVPLLMANFNAKNDILPNIMWIMDRLFKYTNFGIVSIIHQDFFITAGKRNRDESILALRDHIKSSFLKRDRKWMVLFPEGGFLRKRKEVSKRFAKKKNLPILENVSLPRVGALKAIMDAMSEKPEQISSHSSLLHSVPNGLFKENENILIRSENGNMEKSLLEYILDITIAYPNGRPLDLPDILIGIREPCETYMLYRLYKVADIPKDGDDLTQWLYDRFIEKNTLLENFYKIGSFYTEEPMNSHFIQQDFLRFVLVNIFFIASTYFHYQVLCKLYTHIVYFSHAIIFSKYFL